MKTLIISCLLFVSSQAFSQENLRMREFSQTLQQDIDEVLENNPQIYEKKTLKKGRGPASIAPVDKVEEKERYKEKYDKNLGLKAW